MNKLLKLVKNYSTKQNLAVQTPFFKEACLEILPRARNALSDEEFKHLVVCATERMNERVTPES